MKDIGYTTEHTPEVTLQTVVEDGFRFIEPGEGFEYTIGQIRGGNLKLVFEPDSKDFSSAVIEDGYRLVYEKGEV